MRPAHGLLLVALLASLPACKLGDLVNDPPVGDLVVSLAEVTDSAAVGSRALVRRAISITGTGATVQSYRVSTASGSAWVRLSVSGGPLPGAVTVSLDPTGLPLGIHRDTVIVAAVGGTAEPRALPVRFTIHPCHVAALVVGTGIADSLGTDDCASPRADNHFAKLYAFAASANDSLSILLGAPRFEGVLRIERAAAGLLTESRGCPIPAGDQCLLYVRLPQTGQYVVEVSSAAAGQTGPFSLSVDPPRLPAAPLALQQLRADSTTPIAPGGSLAEATVVFTAVLEDADPADTLRLDVEVRPAGTPFTSTATAASAPVANGKTGTAAMTGLSDDTDYRWQVRAVDQTGRAGPWTPFGAGGGADFHIAVPNAPDSPTSLAQRKTDQVTVLAPGDATDEKTVLFSAVLTDSDPGDLLLLEVEVRPVGTPFSNRAVGSSVLVASGEAATVTITGLDDDVDYHWQARAVDQLGNASAWSSFGANSESATDFRVAVPEPPLPPATPGQYRRDGTTPVAVGETVTDDVVVVDAVLADPDPGDLLHLEVAVQRTGTVFTNTPTHSSGTVSDGGTATISVGPLDDDRDYHWRARTVDQRGMTSGWVSFGGNADGEVDFRVAVPASELVFTTQPSTATAGSAIVPAVTLTAQEPSGTTDTSFAGTVIVSLVAGTGDPGATLSGITSMAADQGVATFASLSIDRAGGAYRFSAVSGGLTAESDPFDVNAASAGRLVLTTAPPAGAQSASPFAPQPELQLEDSNGNPVNQAGVTVTAAIVSGPSGAVLSSATATTNGAGVAVFTGLTITGPVGSYRVQFSAPDIASVTSDPIVLSAGPAVRLTLSTQPPPAAQSGVPFSQQPVVQLEDAGGNPVGPSGIQITAAIDSGGGSLSGTTTVNTDANGAAAFTDLSIGGTVGDRVLRFSSPGLTAARGVPTSVSAGPATDMSVHAGDNQSAVAGTPVAVPPAVLITDAHGNRVADESVTFAVASGGGTVNPTAPVSSDADGIAAVSSWTLGTNTGANTLTATAPGLAGSPATFTATATAGAAGGLSIETQPSGAAQSGTIFPQQPAVQVRDENGNPVAQAGIVVTAGIASGPGGSLGGDVSVATDGSGRASFADLSISGTVGDYTLAFSATGLSGVISQTIALSAGAPARLALAVQPSSAPRNGIPFAQQPVVQVEDAAGNAVAQSGIGVAAGILSGGGMLDGTVSRPTDASGMATFTDLSLVGVVGDRTLIFAASGLQSVISNTLTLTAGDPTALAVTTEPSPTVPNGAAFPQQPAVQLRDQSGNAVPADGISVTASIATGGGSLGGTLAVATDPSGVASFGDLAITGVVGARTLAFSSAGLTPATSAAVEITPGPAAALAVSVEPSASATNGEVIVQQPVLQLQDESGNPVASSGVPVTAAVSSGNGSLSGGVTVVTDSSGIARFDDLVITGQVGDYVLSFTSSGLSGANSATIALLAGAATGLVLTTQPADTAQSGVVFERQPVVQVVDQSGNAVALAGVDVAAAILSGGGALFGTTPITTDASGVATFTDLAIAGTPGDRRLIFAAAGLQSVTSNTITVTL